MTYYFILFSYIENIFLFQDHGCQRGPRHGQRRDGHGPEHPQDGRRRAAVLHPGKYYTRYRQFYIDTDNCKRNFTLNTNLELKSKILMGFTI